MAAFTIRCKTSRIPAAMVILPTVNLFTTTRESQEGGREGEKNEREREREEDRDSEKGGSW